MELNTYEAKVTLVSGAIVYATLEAENRNDAKYEFAHSPTVMIRGRHYRVVKVDYRSVRKV